MPACLPGGGLRAVRPLRYLWLTTHATPTAAIEKKRQLPEKVDSRIHPVSLRCRFFSAESAHGAAMKQKRAAINCPVSATHPVYLTVFLKVLTDQYLSSSWYRLSYSRESATLGLSSLPLRRDAGSSIFASEQLVFFDLLNRHTPPDSLILQHIESV